MSENKGNPFGRIFAKLGRTRKRRLGVLAAMASVLIVASIATAALPFVQTVPGQSFPGSKISGVPTLSYDSTSSSYGATTAWAVFNGTTAPAFTVNTEGSYTPTFGYGSGETGVGIISSTANGHPVGAATTTCHDFGSYQNLTSGRAVTGFTAGSMWDYCMDGVPGGSLSTFTISWA